MAQKILQFAMYTALTAASCGVIASCVAAIVAYEISCLTQQHSMEIQERLK